MNQNGRNVVRDLEQKLSSASTHDKGSQVHVDRNTVHVDEKAEIKTTDVNKYTITEELTPKLKLNLKTIQSTPR